MQVHNKRIRGTGFIFYAHQESSSFCASHITVDIPSHLKALALSNVLKTLQNKRRQADISSCCSHWNLNMIQNTSSNNICQLVRVRCHQMTWDGVSICCNRFLGNQVAKNGQVTRASCRDCKTCRDLVTSLLQLLLLYMMQTPAEALWQWYLLSSLPGIPGNLCFCLIVGMRYVYKSDPCNFPAADSCLGQKHCLNVWQLDKMCIGNVRFIPHAHFQGNAPAYKLRVMNLAFVKSATKKQRHGNLNEKQKRVSFYLPFGISVSEIGF